MTCKEIIKHIEDWAPKEIAWQKDNVGLQVGASNREVKNIILCLEITEEVIDDAIKKKCNFIFTHHPLLFRPLKKIDLLNDKNSLLIEKLIKNDIILYSAHTNLDFTKDGVSFELAKILELKDITFLSSSESNQYKLAVFVPENAIDNVAEAVFKAGAGKIGEYTDCSYRTAGRGTFKGSDKSNPKIGNRGVLETVNEIKLEVVVNSWYLNKVIRAMIEAHPYEEPAYDIYALKNPNNNYGAGALGILKEKMTEDEFLKYVSGQLKVKNFRYVKGKNTSVKKVALCGGAGSDLIEDAVNSGADAFITADIKYHAFQDASRKILLIDAGHYETEIHSLNEVQRRLDVLIRKNNGNIKIFKYDGSTNPIIFYNN